MNTASRLIAALAIAAFAGLACAEGVEPPAAPASVALPSSTDRDSKAPAVSADAPAPVAAAPQAAETPARSVSLLDVLREAAAKLAAPSSEKPQQPALVWVIEKDERIDLALKRWAAEAGWGISWLPKLGWESPSHVEFKGSFTDAVIRVVESLNQDGKRLRLRIFDYEGGRYMEVVSDAQS